jgi:magnesium-transporting ATPase (P-type)
VDESSLTGESTPVVKQAINSNSKSLLLLSNEKNSWLYSGTVISKVIYNNNNYDDKDKVRAIVGKTGFNTAKGIKQWKRWERDRMSFYYLPIQFFCSFFHSNYLF